MAFIYRNTKTGALVTVPCTVNGNWELVKELGSEKPKKKVEEPKQEEVTEELEDTPVEKKSKKKK